MIGEPWPVAYPGYNVPSPTSRSTRHAALSVPLCQRRHLPGRSDDPGDPGAGGAGQRSAIRIGQPLPVGYDTYNVPFAYRDQYYDTDDAWYRYANGYVYQVDPSMG